jgi:hypothetical protein
MNINEQRVREKPSYCFYFFPADSTESRRRPLIVHPSARGGEFCRVITGGGRKIEIARINLSTDAGDRNCIAILHLLGGSRRF